MVRKPVCLVLGAGAGVGQAVARRFAKEGFHLGSWFCGANGVSVGTSRANVVYLAAHASPWLFAALRAFWTGWYPRNPRSYHKTSRPGFHICAVRRGGGRFVWRAPGLDYFVQTHVYVHENASDHTRTINQRENPCLFSRVNCIPEQVSASSDPSSGAGEFSMSPRFIWFLVRNMISARIHPPQAGSRWHSGCVCSWSYCRKVQGHVRRWVPQKNSFSVFSLAASRSRTPAKL